LARLASDLPDRIRAFIAVRMSAEVETAIEGLINPLSKLGGGTRWVHQHNLHLTLRFLGNTVERNRLVVLDSILNEIAAQTSPFILSAHGTGAFPNLDRPRTIWIGLASEALVGLAQQVENATVEAGFPPEGRPYSPHLTIGRVRDFSGWQQIRRALRQPSIQDFGSTLVSEMILYRSILGGESSQYQPLARYTFRAAPPLSGYSA
jgi:RNA 2',3'-cyclic 3'-phosphodiesterase